MFKRPSTPLPRILGLAAAAATLALSASGVAAASSDTTEPAADETMHTEHEMSDASIVEAGEPSSPEAAAFCEAEVAAEAAFNSEDPELIGPASEALVAAAPDDDVLATVEAVLANAEAGPEDPAFLESYGAMIEYMRANCGYTELNVTASEYEFGGLPPELPAGPAIVSLANIGEEVHEIVIVRVNDEVTLSLDELFELPEEESEAMMTFVGFAFTFPGETGNTVLDLTPGRHVALCFLPEGAAPEVIAQMGGPEDTPPEEAEFGPPHFVLGMVHEFEVV
jgi:hypothetical protein